jgi:hypothetical protein
LPELREQQSSLTYKIDDLKHMITEAAETGNIEEVMKLGQQRCEFSIPLSYRNPNSAVASL